MTTSSTHLAGLDGLRGLAALAVFGVHYNQIVQLDYRAGGFDLYRLLANGEHGVALFFILSGFLLSIPFWQAILHKDHAWPSMKLYAVRRLARILPAYYMALTILVVVTGLWRIPSGWIDIALHYTFLFNYAEFSFFSINAPFWTLAVEIQFYLLMPLLFWTVRKLRAWQIAGIFVLFGVLAWAINYWLASNVTHVVYWPDSTWLVWIRPYGAVVTHSLLAHLPHFLIGMTGAWLYLTFNQRGFSISQRLADLIFFAALIAAFAILSTYLADRVQIPYGRYGLPLVPLLLGVMVTLVSLTGAAKAILESYPLRTLGLVSYGLYIYHLPCMTLIDRTMAEHGFDAAQHAAVFGILSALLSLAAATLSFLLVEKPILWLVHRRSA